MKTSNKQKSEKTKKIHWIWLLLAVFIAKELMWSYLTPPWQAPDETAHFGYVETLFYEQQFPVLGQTTLSERVQDIGPDARLKNLFSNATINRSPTVNSKTIDDEYVSSTSYNWIAQHPPLYYLMLEPFYAFLPHQDPLLCIYFLRLISILLGCVTLFYAQKTLKILLPENELTQKAVVVGMAFLPMFSSISAVMNNDNLVFALAGILTYLSVKNFETHDTKGSTYMGLMLGLLAVTKATSLPLFLSIFLLEVVKHLRLKHQEAHGYPKCFLKHQLAIFGTAAIIAGGWYVRNILMYKMFLPDIGTLAVRQPFMLQLDPGLRTAFPETTGVVALPSATLWDFFVREKFLLEYAKNIWGAFGQFFFRLFTWQYVIVAVIAFASFFGYVKAVFTALKKYINNRGTDRKLNRPLQKILSWKGWTMILPFTIVAAAITYELFQIYKVRGFLSAMQGRYMFSALLAFMYLLLKGLQNLSPKKYLPMVLILVMTFFVLNDFTALVYRIIPEFF